MNIGKRTSYQLLTDGMHRDEALVVLRAEAEKAAVEAAEGLQKSREAAVAASDATSVADAAQGDAAQALARPYGINLLPNGDFSAWDDANGRPSAWAGSGNGGVLSSSALNLSAGWSLLGNQDRYNQQWLNTPCFSQAGTLGNPNAYYEWISPRIPVEAGKKYAASAYTGAHRCNVEVFIYWCDASSDISATEDGDNGFNRQDKSGGTALQGYKRTFTIGVAPAAAIAARVSIRKYDTAAGNTDSYAFMARAQFEELPLTATGPGPWQAPASNGFAVQAGSIALTAQQRAQAASDGVADLVAGDVVVGRLETLGYAEDANGNPTQGAKMTSQGTALKVAAGNLQIGDRTLSVLTSTTTMAVGAGWSLTINRVTRAFGVVGIHLNGIVQDQSSASWYAIGTIPAEYRPTHPTDNVSLIGRVLDSSTGSSYVATFNVHPDGTVALFRYGNPLAMPFTIGNGDVVNLYGSFVRD